MMTAFVRVPLPSMPYQGKKNCWITVRASAVMFVEVCTCSAQLCLNTVTGLDCTSSLATVSAFTLSRHL